MSYANHFVTSKVCLQGRLNENALIDREAGRFCFFSYSLIDKLSTNIRFSHKMKNAVFNALNVFETWC